ncbi:MAG: hypothetical protein PUE58_08010 [Lachnospiraceae bacterium]|nr:hypothetical protein [Lachnospiraceae bacterium]
MDIEKKRFGRLFCDIREGMRLTIEDVTCEVCDSGVLRRLEKGESLPSERIMEKILDRYLDLGMDPHTADALRSHASMIRSQEKEERRRKSIAEQKVREREILGLLTNAFAELRYEKTDKADRYLQAAKEILQNMEEKVPLSSYYIQAGQLILQQAWLQTLKIQALSGENVKVRMVREDSQWALVGPEGKTTYRDWRQASAKKAALLEKGRKDYQNAEKAFGERLEELLCMRWPDLNKNNKTFEPEDGFLLEDILQSSGCLCHIDIVLLNMYGLYLFQGGNHKKGLRFLIHLYEILHARPHRNPDDFHEEGVLCFNMAWMAFVMNRRIEADHLLGRCMRLARRHVDLSLYIHISRLRIQLQAKTEGWGEEKRCLELNRLYRTLRQEDRLAASPEDFRNRPLEIWIF